MPVSADISNRLDGIQFLGCLGEAALRDVEKRCRWRRYRPGAQILDKDSSDSDVYFVVDGSVQIVNYSLTGREIAFARLAAGNFFGELSAIDGAPRSASVVADKESLLAAMPASLFTRLVVSEPEMVQHLLLRLAGIIRSCDERIMDLSTLGAVQRVYLELMRLAEESRPDGETGDDWRISPLPTHKAIAGLASTTRETVARSMSQLVSGGIIERKGKTIVIRDFDRLERLAGALEVEWPGNLSR
jgi:CRP-like cAMP-binding protein